MSKTEMGLKEIDPFVSLFVPQHTWFQDLFKKNVVEKQSLSAFLVDLAVEDLYRRKEVTETQYREYRTYVKAKRNFRKTRLREGDTKRHKVFSLYLPQSLSWLRTKLSSENLSKSVGASSRSHYIWDLFVHSQKKSLAKNHYKEWELANLAPKGEDPRKAA